MAVAQDLLRIRTLHVYEAFLYLFILIMSFTPARYIPVFTVFDIKISMADALIILIFIMLIPMISIGSTLMIRGSTVAWIYSCLILWAFISLLWLVDTDLAIGYYVYPLLLSFIIMLNGYLFSKLCAIVPRDDLLLRICLVLTVVFVIYAMESLFAIGLRSEEGIYISDSFGFDRLKGPLAGPTAINILMLPVLSFYLGNVLRGKEYQYFNITGAVITAFCIFLTGSRAAMIGIVLLVVMFLISSPSAKNRIKLIVLFVIIGIFTITIIPSSRLSDFQDMTRQENLYTSWIILNESTSSFFLGKGYGSIWPWYYNDMELFTGGLGYSDVIMRNTIWGRVLYHPHSIVIALPVELGVVSLLVFLIMLGLICGGLFKRKQTTVQYLLYGVASTIPLFFFDLYLIKNWKPSMIWWIFVFIVLSKRFIDDEKMEGKNL